MLTDVCQKTYLIAKFAHSGTVFITLLYVISTDEHFLIVDKQLYRLENKQYATFQDNLTTSVRDWYESAKK